jgi:hypothetical protein
VVKLYSTKPLTVTIESAGQKLTLDLSKSTHRQKTDALNFQPPQATKFIVDQLQFALGAFCPVERVAEVAEPVAKKSK